MKVCATQIPNMMEMPGDEPRIYHSCASVEKQLNVCSAHTRYIILNVCAYNKYTGSGLNCSGFFALNFN